MAVLELKTNSVDRVLRTLTHTVDLSPGAACKAELGDDELDAVVPAGKRWSVQATFYIVETDV